ncbi:cell division protein ZapA [Dongia soli]|uniref:Cell division protein ZapA n=1 Tax=Dongia soli TaxID=600628 RepID=A0ABU5ECW8_9PROT|nr:cell division protein ZapA [Dongia soli]MDY0883400.1 cell division protein ZapA [Dongia soli]
MPTVTVFLNGRNYDVACGPGEEARVQEVAGRLRERMEGLAKSLGSVQENLLFAVTSLLLADELEQREREVVELQAVGPTEREAAMVDVLENLAAQIEAIAARLEAA